MAEVMRARLNAPHTISALSDALAFMLGNDECAASERTATDHAGTNFMLTAFAWPTIRFSFGN
jgi:hypothetical protein